MRRPRERGAASVLLLAGLSVVMVLGVVATGVAAVGTSQVRVSQAADLAALAGAEKAWLDRSAACAVAHEVADRHQVRLVACEAVGLDVQVHVQGSLPGALSEVGAVHATARAGPPD